MKTDAKYKRTVGKWHGRPIPDEDQERGYIRRLVMKNYGAYGKVSSVIILILLCLSAILSEYTILTSLSGELPDKGILALMAVVPLAAASLTYEKMRGWAGDPVVYSLTIAVSSLSALLTPLLAAMLYAVSMDIPFTGTICCILAGAFLIKAAVHVTGTIRTELMMRSMESSRDWIKNAIDKVLAGSGTVMFPAGGHREGAAVLPGGRVERLLLGADADVLLQGVREVRPGSCAEDVLIPAQEAVLSRMGKGYVGQWARKVRRDAKKKCSLLSGLYVIMDIKGRAVIGLTKTGQAAKVYFPENVYLIFDAPEDIRGLRGASWKVLQEKLLPVNALIRIREYYHKEE